MSDKGQQEPSMEEILASIRRIISEDGDQAAKEEDDFPAPAPPPPPPPPPQPPPPPPPMVMMEPEEDILELTDEAPEPAFAPVVEEPVDEFDPWKMEPPVFEPPPPPPPPPPRRMPVFDEPDEPPPRPRSSINDGLISRSTADIASSHFTHLARELGDDLSIGPMPIGIRSVEDVVRELLRPLLKEWLDENLPTVVERLVQQEIDRMIRRTQKF